MYAKSWGGRSGRVVWMEPGMRPVVAEVRKLLMRDISRAVPVAASLSVFGSLI